MSEERKRDVEKFNSIKECPKCGFKPLVSKDGLINWTRNWHIVRQVLDVTCYNCLYFWVEDCKDADNS